MEDIIGYGRQCLQDEAQALLELTSQLDQNFSNAVEMMFHCKGKVIVTGVGKSGHVGAKVAATLASTGTPSFFMNPLDAYHGDLGVITADDVVLAISNSGNTDDLLRFIPVLKQKQVHIIGMSSDAESLLAKYSDCHILVKVDHEACPLNLAPTSSTTAQLAMGDALAVALMRVRHFQSTDFAQFHPGGHLGKLLLTTAADVMRKDDLPTLSEDMHLSDAIICISKGMMGLGVAIDQNDKVIGLLTNGDIRRAMERWQEKFFNHTVGDIMTREPVTVTKDTKISEILNILQQRKIHMVLVLDEEHRLLGIVDHYNCLI